MGMPDIGHSYCGVTASTAAIQAKRKGYRGRPALAPPAAAKSRPQSLDIARQQCDPKSYSVNQREYEHQRYRAENSSRSGNGKSLDVRQDAEQVSRSSIRSVNIAIFLNRPTSAGQPLRFKQIIPRIST